MPVVEHEPLLDRSTPTPDPGTVGVVITAHAGELPSLVDTVDTLRRQTHPADAVVILVDGPEKDAAPVREALPDHLVVATGRRLGAAHARSAGARLLSTQWVAFLDSGARAEPVWLENLLAVTRDDAVLGVSALSLPLYESAPPRWLPDEHLWVFGCTPTGEPDATMRRMGPHAGSGLMRRSVFLLLGGAGDVLERQMAWDDDGAFEHTTAAVVYQRVPRSRTTWRFFLRRCLDEGAARHRVVAPVTEPGTVTQAARLVRSGRIARACGMLAAGFALALGRQRAKWADSRTLVLDHA